MRHHIYDTQDAERLCAFLDALEPGSMVALHCIPDVGGPHWFVIWKQHRKQAKGPLGFAIPDREERHREAVPLGSRCTCGQPMTTAACPVHGVGVVSS